MEERLRGMRVNMDQRKRLMNAGRFGIGPLIELGMVEKKDCGPPIPMLPASFPQALTPAAAAAVAEQERQRRDAMLGGPPTSGNIRTGANSGRDQEQRRQAWRKLHEEDGLQDLQSFLAPKRPARAAGVAALPGATSSSRAAIATKESEENDRVEDVSKKLEVKISASQRFLQPRSETVTPPDPVRASASNAGARPKAAIFKAIPGPTADDVRHLQTLHEPASDDVSYARSDVLEAAIEELREEEVRRAKRWEKRKREEWRKAWKEEKRFKKLNQAKPVRQAAQDEDIAESSCSSSASSHSNEGNLVKSGIKAMDSEQKKFWGKTVKGRVSNDNKGFTDADLEQRFQSQQAASAGEKLMTESEVLALLKVSGGTEKGKEKTKKKEYAKGRSSRSRERRR